MYFGVLLSGLADGIKLEAAYETAAFKPQSTTRGNSRNNIEHLFAGSQRLRPHAIMPVY
jgi:hypothetical protein